MKKIVLLFFMFFISNVSFSQSFTDTTTGLRYTDDLLNCYGSDISLLPKRIHIEENKIILFVDFGNEKQDTILFPNYENARYDIIPIYTINTTEKPWELGSEGILILQQYKDTLGNWIRSESFNYGWCGSSLPINITLNPNEFMKTITILNSGGKKETVRYTLYKKDIKLTSNSGVGLVDEEEIEKAKFDDVTFKFGNIDFLKSIASGTLKIESPIELNVTTRSKAIFWLSTNFPKEAIPILIELSTSEDSTFKRQALYNLENIKKRLNQ